MKGGRLTAYSTTSSSLLRQSQNADAGVLVWALPVTIKRFQIEGKLAQVFGFEANSLQLKCHEVLQITVIGEQVQFKILVTDLHTHLLTYNPGTGEPDRSQIGPRQLNEQFDPPL